MSRMAIFFLVVITLGLTVLLALLGLTTLRSNLLGWFLLISGLVYFFGIVIVYWVRRIRFWGPRAGGEMLKEERNDWSFWLIVVGMIAAFYLPPIEYLFFAAVLPRLVWMQVLDYSSYFSARFFSYGRVECSEIFIRGMSRWWKASNWCRAARIVLSVILPMRDIC